MFIGRQRELETLENIYKKDDFQMVVMYGRRRMGKTTLISKFVENKPSIFFTAQEVNDKANLVQFSKKIFAFFSMPKATPEFHAWDDLFDFLAEKAQNGRFVLAFDEFPYAAQANRSLKSILQIAIDHSFKNTNIFIILCGSQMSFMENEVLGYKSPLFCRRTVQIKIEEFDYLDAARFAEEFSNEDKIKFYSTIGGTPHYLSQIDKNESFEENIKRLYFDMSGYLYNELMMLLQQELREPAMYNSIICAIAAGATKLNEISTKIGEDRTKTIKYLYTLINLGILIKEFPFGEDMASSRKGIYRISDNCYNFWYRFVFPNKPEIEMGSGAIIADDELFSESLPAFIGKLAFERICRQYLVGQNNKGMLPFTATSFGSWWGNDSKEKRQTDFDVIAANRKTKQIILCECKWKNQFDDVAEIEKLMSKDYLLAEYEDRYYYFFSKCEFSERAKEKQAKNKNLHFITLDMLFE